MNNRDHVLYGREGMTDAQAQAAPFAALLESKAAAPTVGALRDSDSAMPVERIGAQQLSEAMETLERYRSGKTHLEERIKSNEKWWKLRHWEELRAKQAHSEQSPEPSSAWLFNSILNKHADAMDNYPESVCLPRERSDEQSAKMLSSILPVVMEYNDFESTYSYEWWEKLKHGFSIYGVFWDAQKDNGLGDISIERIDPLNIYWEPGCEDIQDSANVFTVSLADTEALEEEYPQFRGKLGGAGGFTTAKYEYDDTVDTSDKRCVIDWYYKRRTASGRTVVHYAKFLDSEHLIYASENDPACREVGFYQHGEYPFVFDVLFPEKGTPAGFGYIAIAKDPQLYIDKLWSNILETSLLNTKRRYFISDSTSVNEKEFLDVNNPLIHVTGKLDEERVRELTARPLDSVYYNIVQMKIDELKETSANRDVSNGGVSGGVSAAAAIAALQEAGNKTSRDMISAAYRAQVKIVKLCIELMREFYDVQRAFRITNEEPYQYAEIGPAQLGDQVTGTAADGSDMFRRPIFDIKIKAQKRNPFSRAEQNERAKELYQLGFFSPDRAQESSIALDMMDFEGIDKIKSQINEGATLYNLVRQQAQQLERAMTVIGQLTGQDMTAAAGNAVGSTGKATGGGIASREADAQTQQTPYMQSLAKRSTPDMNAVSSAATPNA